MQAVKSSPPPHAGRDRPLPRLAGDGKSVCAALCWGLGLGRDAAAQPSEAQLPQRGPGPATQEAQDGRQRHPYQNQLSPRKGVAGLGLTRDFPAV